MVTQSDGTEFWEFEGSQLSADRAQCGGWAAEGRVEHGAGALRRNAPRLLGSRRPARRHGSRRGVGLAVLPVADRGLRRFRVLTDATTPRSGWRACGRGTSGTSTCGSAPARTGSYRCRFRGWSTRPWRRTKSVATPSAGSRLCRFSRIPSTSACPRCTPTIGIRSWRRVRTLTPWSACIARRRVGLRRDHPARRSSYSTSLFPVNALVTAADWLWSGVPARFPSLRICLAESGIDWVPMLVHRIDYVMDHSATGQGAWTDPAHPTDVLRRNFWFSVIDLTSTLQLRHEIGVDHIVLESDYPHADSTWPETKVRAQKALADLPTTEVEQLCWRNASELFRHPGPPASVATQGSAADARRAFGRRHGRRRHGQPRLRGGRRRSATVASSASARTMSRRTARSTSPDRS